MLYKDNKLKEISFPLGGIGSGSIGLAGNGSLIDWEIFNRPNKGSINGTSFFAIRAEYSNGKSVTKVLQGDWQRELMGHYCQGIYHGFGYGPNNDLMCSYPHFKDVTFDGSFPIATLTFEDEMFPGKVIMTAYNPFIPLDEDNSSIPAAFFNIKIENNTDDEIKYTIVFTVTNPFKSTINKRVENDRYTAVQMIYDGVSKDDLEYGDLTIAVDSKDGIIQEFGYRGQWRDTVTTFWHELSRNELHPRVYDTPSEGDTCTVGCELTIAKREADSTRFILTWNIPNNYSYWDSYKDSEGKEISWKNYYAVLFADSTASMIYSFDNWDMLYTKTKAFCESLHSSSLHESIIDAISSNVSVLKSPTVLRLEDGSFYGWEGVHEKAGSCEGTCTHVWSYAYALCFLFPRLERSIRENEFKYDVMESGEMNFRTKLPIGRPFDRFRPCVDGQMATVFKTYREWKLSGDDDWLREHWSTVRRLLEFAWHEENEDEWDRDHDGVMEGRQHHTLDMEMFGPSSWLQGMYMAALKTAAEMAAYLGYPEKEKEYMELYEKGYAYTRDNLFNGEYFIQKVDLENKEYTEHFNSPDYWNEEKGQLKYQMGEGSAIDQMLAQWHANICGFGKIYDEKQRKKALESMMKNNFKESMRELANSWRVFAINDEKGSIICDFPEGANRPIIPVPYSEECMTGFEYSFAGLLIGEGFIDEGIKVVKAIRDRFDGEKRNPWNEFECGSNYARTMASYALIPIFSGFEFDLPHKHVGFKPIVEGDFRSIWHVGTGWGDYFKSADSEEIVIKDGHLELESLKIGHDSKASRLLIDGKDVAFTQEGEALRFNAADCRERICVLF